MKRAQCMVAFGVVLSALGGLVWMIVQAPIILPLLAGSLVLTWAIITTVNCLSSEGE